MTEIKRKGSKSTKDISDDILEQLNSGKIEMANLVEWLAVNQKLLLENLLIQTNRKKYLNLILADIKNLKKQTVNTINEAIGIGLYTQATVNDDSEILEIISTHRSDLIRCWATYTIGKNPNLSLKQVLQQIQPFAADKRFGVREICWLSVRQIISKNLSQSLEILTNWTSHQD